MPPFSELYGLVRSNLTGISEAELNRDAVLGFLSQLPSRVTLVTNHTVSAEAAAMPLLTRTNLFDGAYVLLRVARGRARHGAFSWPATVDGLVALYDAVLA